MKTTNKGVLEEQFLNPIRYSAGIMRSKLKICTTSYHSKTTAPKSMNVKEYRMHYSHTMEYSK